LAGAKSKFSAFFEVVAGSGGHPFGLCKLCKRSNKKVSIKMKNRKTSGLKKHLLSVHKNEAQELFPRKQQQTQNVTIADFFKPTGQVSTSILNLFNSDLDIIIVPSLKQRV